MEKLKNINTEGSESDIKTDTEGSETDNKTDKGESVSNKRGGEILINEGGGENPSDEESVSINKNKSPESKMPDTGEREKERYGPLSRVPVIEEFNDFETWIKCVTAWTKTCNIPKSQQGYYLCQELPKSSARYGITLREDVYRHCPPDELVEDDNGVDKIIAFLKTRFWVDKESSVYDTHRNLKTIKRKKGQALNDYIIEFDKLYTNAKQLKIIPSGVEIDMCMALDLMLTSDLNDVEYMMIKNAVEVLKGDGKRYELVKSKIREIIVGKANNQLKPESEESFLTQKPNTEDDITTDDVYLSRGWTPPNKLPYNNKRYQNNKNRFQNKSYGNKSHSGHNDNKNKTHIRTKPTNPLGSDGKPLKCMSCKAITHMIKDCPDTYEKHLLSRSNKRYQTAYVVNEETEKEEKVLIPISDSDSDQEREGAVYCSVYCSDNLDDLSNFTAEALNKAALDTACTASIAGEKWLDIYLEALPDNMKEKVVGPKMSQKYFLFGNQGKLKSKAKYVIPTKLGGDIKTIELDVISSDIPLLLSKGEMKKLGIVLDMKNDSALMDGKPLILNTTSAGHYVIDLLNNKEEVEEVCIAELDENNDSVQMKALTKIHRQFGHRSKLQFVTILKEAGKWQDKFSKMIDKIMERCEGCIMRLRTPDRPAVAPPMANDFGQVLGMDLKVWDKNKGTYIFYMIDIFTRYQMAAIIKSKEPSEVVNAFTTKWLPIFGTINKIITDNGTEFQNEQMREVASSLNVQLLTTGANSPWQNGTVERNHMTTDSIISAILRDYPKMKLSIALAWAINAVNSMSSVRGFSPYQLVFGRSIKLPNILEDPPPTWEEPEKSQELIDTLNAIHTARVSYTKAERCERIKKALRAKIRIADTIYEKGDIVYFKKEGEDKWRGPAKVVFQDSKVIFLRIGSVYYRVSANRVKKAGESLANDIRERENEENLEELQKENNIEPITQQTKEDTAVLIEPDWHRLRMNDVEQQETTEEVTIGNQGESEIPIIPDNPEIQDNSETENNLEDPFSNNNDEETANNRQTKNKGRKRRKASQKPTPEFNEDGTITNAAVILKRNDRIEILENGKWEKGTILGHGGKVGGKHSGWYNIRLDNGQVFHEEMSEREVRFENGNLDEDTEEEVLLTIKLDTGKKLKIKNPHQRKIRFEKEEEELALFVTEDVLAVMVPREQRDSPECMAAKHDELNKLIAFDTYKVVEDEGQDRITTTWVLTEKGTEKRARLTARGFQEDANFPTDSPTVQKHSMRLLLAIAATEQWDICTTDISSAFLQGSEMDRSVYVKPPREANQAGKLWLLNKCLYGLKDASRKWYLKVVNKLKELDFKTSKYDSGMFYLLKDGKLIGIVALHVDDFLHAGSKYFNTIILPQLLGCFKVGKSETKEFMYTGFYLKQTKEGIRLDQNKYVQNVVIPIIDVKQMKDREREMNHEELSLLRQITGVVNWTARATRPDLSFEMIDLSTKFKGGKVDDLIKAKNVAQRLKKEEVTIKVSNLENFKDCEMIVYTDAAYRNLNQNTDSCGGYIIFIVNLKSGRVAPLEWKSGKLKRRINSTLGAETQALYNGIDAAVGLKLLLQELYGNEINLKVRAVTDNKSARDAVYSESEVAERILRGDIAVLKQMVETEIVTEIRWVTGQNMLADLLTKRGVNKMPLLDVLESGQLSRETLSLIKD